MYVLLNISITNPDLQLYWFEDEFGKHDVVYTSLVNSYPWILWIWDLLVCI